jgi:hypothetical protein
LEVQNLASALCPGAKSVARWIVRLNFQLLGVFLTVAGTIEAAHLGQSAGRAFDDYIRTVEMEIARNTQPAAGFEGDLRAADFQVQPVNGGSWHVSGGLLHHWRATALAPGATAEQMLALLEDYDHLAAYYAPEVASSRMLSGGREAATVLMRFRKQTVLTVVLDAEFETRSGLTAAGRGYTISRSRHIWQVDHPGSARERRRSEGEDDGYLWRLNSYWEFVETPAGLLIECDAVSLTRDVPAGLEWLIRPIIQALPRKSLEFTLTATKNALAISAMRRSADDHAN